MRAMWGCLVFSAVLAMNGAAPSDPTVAVTGGRIRGTLLERGGASFKGIPFAEAPAGNLRWREPRPVRPWSGVRDAREYGAPCAQNAGGHMMETSQEDCLFLNVWAPEWPPKGRRPVMFWIHGGGNFGGTASTPRFDGETLARHGVVLVSANYRLTIFGFFAHPELTRESPHHASGNYGLMDQIAALQWVRDNVAKFGGDPGNVTIFGQSAGAVDADVLMTSPLARGLFQKVIAESGTVTRSPDAATLGMTALGGVMKVKEGPVSYSDAADRGEAEKAGAQLAAMLNAPEHGTLSFLRGLPASELLKASAAPRMSIGPANGVAVDGWVLPQAPAEVFAMGQEQRVPFLIGNNSRERTPPPMPVKELRGAMVAMYGPLAAQAFQLYGLAGAGLAVDPLYGDAAAQWVVDTMYRCPVVAQLAWHAAAGNTGFEYQFDLAPPGREALGAVHGAEVPYVFGALAERYAPADREMAAAIEQYWTNFAKSGDPNGAGLPVWPKFDAARRGYIEFTRKGPVPGEELRQPFCGLYLENVKRLLGR